MSQLVRKPRETVIFIEWAGSLIRAQSVNLGGTAEFSASSLRVAGAELFLMLNNPAK